MRLFKLQSKKHLLFLVSKAAREGKKQAKGKKKLGGYLLKRKAEKNSAQGSFFHAKTMKYTGRYEFPI